eukprot:TRINITY_DN9678_c0_g1_i3.p1 TRINITY_DN9678_c0_g1~~TRINITY_DN9678_c0_g1_i3.p1  ORF type:complete len:138 (-),score=13.72 TRINITY_DN9678_c0_g1_i3:294-707(-)
MAVLGWAMYVNKGADRFQQPSAFWFAFAIATSVSCMANIPCMASSWQYVTADSVYSIGPADNVGYAIFYFVFNLAFAMPVWIWFCCTANRTVDTLTLAHGPPLLIVQAGPQPQMVSVVQGAPFLPPPPPPMRKGGQA